MALDETQRVQQTRFIAQLQATSRTHTCDITKNICLYDISAMTIPSLPEELLVLILEDFALPNYDRSRSRARRRRECLTTLRNSCLASKSLYRLTWPILYRYFSNRTMRHHEDMFLKLDPAMLLQTICTKPQYGLALRSLSVAPWASVEAMDANELLESLQGDATLVALFQWRARGFWLGEDERFSSSSDRPGPDDSLSAALLRLLEMGLPEAHIAMLFLLCPKIKELSIDTPPQFATSVIGRLLDTTLSEGYQTETPPGPVHDPEQEESDYAIAQMFDISSNVPTLQKPLMLQDLVKCRISGSGTMPSGLKFLKKLISLPSLQDLSVSNLQGSLFINATSDLEGAVPCIHMRKLDLPGCSLRTSEVSSIVACLPNLIKLTMLWDKGFGDSDNQTLDQDWILRFGVIADAIATHIPRLESLDLSAALSLQRHFPSEHPYTIGKGLRQMEHLESLALDHHMIYGMPRPEDLSPDQSDVSQHVLRQVLPKGITHLWIEPSEYLAREFGLATAWQAWQVIDLKDLLQDTSFEHLWMIEIPFGVAGIEDHINKEAASKHGWEIEVSSDNLFCEIKRKRRSK